MSRLLDHLPADYRKIREFRKLSGSVSTEYDAADRAFEQVENDQFITSSSEPAIARREKPFGIVPDLTVETLPFRKRRLLARMQENVPYVVEYLRELLDSLLGGRLTEIELDSLLFEMEVLVYVESASFYREVEKLLERIVPLNIDLTVAVLMIREVMVLHSAAYAFRVKHKRTNRFRTAAIPGVLRESTQAVLHSADYAFRVEHPRTNRLKTQTVQGLVADEQRLSAACAGYVFPARLPVTGKLVARSESR
ncbi:putative phage tail protein [Sporosarcina trichiuri]|uniref:putative phage tail protein n=1 Tax=Sporosarcina trichiuri TaxID=3056445 RepID=UPI0025B54194|nr:putative phage tail protein [Sporosarcina sp. 0.2-SM1T-5]WJY27486.1 DUF2313 domain-containing protein [Sporosarcina sp. 0.2-SM1T-5]